MPAFKPGSPKASFDGVIGASFALTVDGGRMIKAIKEVSGLKIEADVIEMKQQTETGNYVNTKLLGRPKAGSITLSRVLSDDDSFEIWMKDSYEGKVPRANATVTVYDTTMKPIKRYTVLDAQPSALEITAMQAGGTSPLEEKLTLQHVGITVEAG